MPAELPGFYWDEARNRYFPIACRPKESVPITLETLSTAAITNRAPKEIDTRSKRQYSPFRTHNVRMTSTSYTQHMRESHDNLCFHYAHTSRLNNFKVPTFGKIRAFHITNTGDRMWRLIGDNQGWLYSDKDLHSTDGSGVRYWSADWNLQPSCPITSISVSGTRVVSTCLGPGKFSVQDLNSPERTFLLNLNSVADIRASHIQGNEVVLGARTKVIHISDIDHSTCPRHINVKSDVFAVFQRNHLVYAGERNGSIERFDTRMASHQGQKLFDIRFGESPRSTVLYLNTIREYELLLSHLNGDLVSFDLRFPSSRPKAGPLRIFEGHVNNYLCNLGIAVDQEEEFLFAAGQDCRIRAWSLRTGLPLPEAKHTETLMNPFKSNFPSPISALQVTRDLGSNGISLWAAYDHDLSQFCLGQREL